MLRKRKKFSLYNNGIILICREIPKKSSFGAAENTLTMEDLEVLDKLDFGQMSRRDEDLKFAESEERTLNLKVKTRIRRYIRKGHKAVIGNVLYTIFKADFSEEKQETYLYLEEERELDDNA